MLKKFLAGFLASAIALTAGILPNFSPAIYTEMTASAADETSGTCGDNLTWELSDDGVLTISGTGNMYDYDYDSPFYGRSAIKSVVIEEGVTSIGDSAFRSCTSLKTVTIGDGVIFIGDEAFYECTSITSITIPDSVASIKDCAFFYCESLESINVSESNTYYTSKDGVLFDKNMTKLIQYPIGNSRTAYIIPDSITSIENCAFLGCKSLESITIPDGVVSIGVSAFCECTSLESMTIPESVTSIEDDMFYGCANLKSVTIPDSVASIGNDAFRSCTSLKSITIPDSVTSIGDSAFYKCESLESIAISNPNCKIYDTGTTICYEYLGNANFIFYGTIYGYENSTAQAYAEKYGYNFKSISEYANKWTILDLVKLQNYIANSETEINDEYDLNGDDEINVFDAMLLRNKLIYGG